MAPSKLLACAALLLLMGCNSAVLTCIPLHQYTVAEKKAAAQQYKAAKARGDSEALLHLVDDYGVERDAIRACLKHRK